MLNHRIVDNDFGRETRSGIRRANEDDIGAGSWNGRNALPSNVCSCAPNLQHRQIGVFFVGDIRIESSLIGRGKRGGSAIAKHGKGIARYTRADFTPHVDIAVTTGDAHLRPARNRAAAAANVNRALSLVGSSCVG